MTKPRFSFEKHVGTGSKLRAIRNELLYLSTEIKNAWPHKAQVCRLADGAVHAVDELRHELDSQLIRDCPAETEVDGGKGVYF